MSNSNPTLSFIDVVVVDPHDPPRLTTLVGYPGAAAAPTQRRLYLDIALTEYVDRQRDAVVHEQAVSGEYGLPAVLVWVRDDARLTHHTRTPTGDLGVKGTAAELAGCDAVEAEDWAETDQHGWVDLRAG
ncbi:hypothetical protein [Enhygromyxa salina]|uniref:Uncharacterized protein n=1 Tax=Enhygromyxa salina TaxID=215803 RepID=A0A2S9YTH3_9BACT|nr:hypothetical protein [Enhygromyxa salina]PRQ08339.1 hypothetical protein ENSA7_19660 [Enhygromyxa salina]